MSGKIVSHVLVMERRLRIGSAWVRCGAVGDVWTLPRYRKRGYAARLMEHSIELMTREGFEVSFLFGIPDFYQRFGYAAVLPERRISIPTRSRLAAARGWKVRRLKSAEIEQALGLLRRDTRGRTGAFERSQAAWRVQERSPWPGPFQSWALIDPGGRLGGVLRLRVHPARPIELAELVGLDREGGVRTGLAWALARARRAGLERLGASLPPDGRIHRWLAACGAELKTSYPLTGGGSLRILRLDPLLRRLRPDLERRLRASPPADGDFSLHLKTDLGEAGLSWSNGRLGVSARPRDGAGRIELPQTLLAALVFGYTDVTAAAARYGLELAASARRLLEVLFPVGCPFVAAPDYF